jgi:hypothetical protein
MPVSTAQALTKQFYDWERCGRGWYKTDYTVDLEPPFYPFFGHGVSEEIIDDGKCPSWFDAIADLFKQPPTQSARPVTQEERQQAFPNDEEAALTIYVVIVPRQFKQSTAAIEQLLIMLSYRKSPISFEIIGSEQSLSMQWVCTDPDAVFVYTQLRAFFPECTILETDSDKLLDILRTELPAYTVDFGLQEEFMRPLATHPTLDHEPLTALFGLITHLQFDEYIILQFLFTGTHNAWAESIMTAVCDETGKQSFFLDALEMPTLAREKVSRPLYGVSIRALTIAPELSAAAILLQHVATAIIHTSASHHNALVALSDTDYNVYERLADIVLRVSHRVGMLLNSRELVTFVHYPTLHALNKKLLHNSRASKAAPESLIGHDYILGINHHQGIEMEVSIPVEQRCKHIHLIGATGTGKSTLLHSLIMHDIAQGNGLAVLDPHGDLIDCILAGIPAERISDVVLIDPSDSQFPIGFNILCAYSDLEKELLASDLVALFKRFSTSWGDQMNSVFANAIMAFVYNTTQYHLGDLRRFLIEHPYRNLILLTATDPEISYYWHKEFPLLKSTSIGPILTRLDAFLRPKIIRNMVCQKKSLNIQELMDTKKIILVKLSQGLLGVENSFLLGAVIVSKLQQTAMSRQAQATKDRVPFYCYIDEFHHFITPSMATILSGARKYKFGLILAHQDMQQVSKYDPEIANSLLANAGTRICFRMGDTDAKRLQEGFSAFTVEDLQNLNTGEALVRVNTADHDFNIDVIPFESDNNDATTDIAEYSRLTYSIPIKVYTPESEPTQVPQPPISLISKEPAKPASVEPHNTDNQSQHIREHRYLQTFIKKMAEEYGYKACLEVPTPDGAGLVDIVLEKESQIIAVEISVTTTAEWELHNIQKCLSAGYEKILVCVSDTKKSSRIMQLMEQHIAERDQKKVFVVRPDMIQSMLRIEQPPKENATVMKGYRVKVQYDSAGTDKQALLKSIITAAKKK